MVLVSELVTVALCDSLWTKREETLQTISSSLNGAGVDIGIIAAGNSIKTMETA